MSLETPTGRKADQSAILAEVGVYMKQRPASDQTRDWNHGL